MKNKGVYIVCSISSSRRRFIAGVFNTKKEIEKVMRDKGFSYSKIWGVWYKKGEDTEYEVSIKHTIGELFLG